MEGIFDINNTDTICAVSTPPGRGGIAVVRVSGSKAVETVGKIWKGRPLSETAPRSAIFGNIFDGNELLDQAVAVIFRAPASFTGDDTVELSIHGSPYIQRRLLQLLTSDPFVCRLALPGEFTRRAFLAGKIDLSQAEAIGDLISATSKGAHRLAACQLEGSLSTKINTLREKLVELASLLELELDFSEEDVEFASRPGLIAAASGIDGMLARLESSFSSGQAIINGIPVVIAGIPNAGKSTILNLLLDDERAIVSDIPGTTRDIIEATTEISGITFRFIDTAGLRGDTSDIVEQEGIRRAKNRIGTADIIVYLFDTTISPDTPSQFQAWDKVVNSLRSETATIIPVLSKTDIASPASIQRWRDSVRSRLSALPEHTHAVEPVEHSTSIPSNLQKLRSRLIDTARVIIGDSGSGDPVLTNVRQLTAVRLARQDIASTIAGLKESLSPDLVAQHLRSALASLAEITGAITTPDLLTAIFSRFCIGK